MKLRWDIFCTIVDNFGDVGFCWRLARQLVSEHGLEVRLWVDDLAIFSRIAP
ncbi:MAG: elongation factor P maturation arginine rhamnosyltransferase EarP, partial [Nitrosomonadaceae bacterium]